MLDLSDRGAFADGPPFDAFRVLRDEQPVHWNASASGRPFWSVTRYADIARAVRDWETFSSQRTGITIEQGGVFPAEMQELAFVMMDPPSHTKHRGIVQKVFTPKVVREQEPEIREAMHRLVDTVVEAGQCDLVDDLAVDFRLIVIADILGVPQADRRRLFQWTNTFADTSLSPEQGTAVLMEIAGYVMALVAERRATPRDDLVSALITAEIDRDGEKHLSFSAGRHFCLGNQLARLELRVALSVLLERLPDLELAGPIVREPSNIFHWIRSMPVAFSPVVAAA